MKKSLYIWNVYWILATPCFEWDLVILQINALQSFIYSFLYGKIEQTLLSYKTEVVTCFLKKRDRKQIGGFGLFRR